MSSKSGEIDFVKMHGAGNDYIYIDYTHGIPSDLPTLSRLVSDRHFGIGSDGLVAILPSDKADFRMRMFNADGSEAQMCGNASRCIGKYVYDRFLTDKTTVTLETLAGIKVLTLFPGPDGKISKVSVDMGIPVTDPAKVPVIAEGKLPTGPGTVGMEFDGEKFEAVAVSMGNPHAVIFIDHTPDDRLVLEAGPAFERHPAWPEKVNVEFARILSPESAEMRVWERGSGETMACGTGACATAVAGVLTGRLGRQSKIALRGGTLEIEWDASSGHLFMTGPAATIAEGRFFYGTPSDTDSPSDDNHADPPHL